MVARRRGPLGPLLAERAEELERRGLLEPGARFEELLLARAQAGRVRNASLSGVRILDEQVDPTSPASAPRAPP